MPTKDITGIKYKALVDKTRPHRSLDGFHTMPSCQADPARFLPKSNFDAFVAGAASVIDLSGHTVFRLKICPNDYEALRADWEVVGQDFRRAARELAREILRARDAGQETLFDADDLLSDR